GEGFDILGGERVTPDVADLANTNVLEELHGSLGAFGCPPRAALAARRPNIGLTTRVITGWSAVLMSSNLNVTTPTSGRLREARVSSTVARALIRSPGRIGASQFTSSTPGAPMKLAWPMKSSLSIRIKMQQLCQPDAMRPPNRFARAAASSRC